MTRRPPPSMLGPPDANGAAAWWDARLRSPVCSAADRKAFAAWRAEAAEHAAAFERLQTGVRGLHDIAATDPQLRAIHDRARVAAGRRGGLDRIAAILVALVLLGVGAFVAYRVAGPEPEPVSIYRTAAGERSTVRLADGSVVMLNSKTEVRVAYRKKQRNVTLMAGEAVFDVAKDPSRPFTVAAGRREVVAVGTAFSVRLDPRELRVIMIEGKVKVAPAGEWRQRPKDQILVAGQRMVAGANALEVKVDAADISRDTAWLEDKLIFEGETLDYALVEINRHTDKPIRIGDPSLNSLSISGMFRTTQPEKFLDALTSYYPVDARSSATGETVLYRR